MEDIKKNDLEGTNTPQVFFNALVFFFKHARFYIYQNNIPIDLMHFLPNLVNRFAFMNTIHKMIYSYVLLNSLNDLEEKYSTFSPNKLIIKAFGSNIPAFNFLYKEDGINRRDIMRHLVDKGLLQKSLNTFEVVKSLHPEFNKDKIRFRFIKPLIYSNVNPIAKLEALKTN